VYAIFGGNSMPEPNPEDPWADEHDEVDYGSDTDSELDESLLVEVDNYETDEYYSDSDSD